MDPRVLSRSSESVETLVAWCAACLSVAFTLLALMPTYPLRLLAGATAIAITVAVAPTYLRRATPFTAAALTVAAAFFSTAAVIRLSRLPWETGISWSQAGGVGQPTAWLFTTTSLCFATGVLVTGRLIVRVGARSGDLSPRSHVVASVLPVTSFVGFALLAVLPVGGLSLFSTIHNIASWAALGSFWFGMLMTPWTEGTSRALKTYSILAAVAVFATWLPNGLRFMGLTEARPVSMLAMELTVFPLCLLWFCWLGWEWSRTCVTPS